MVLGTINILNKVNFFLGNNKHYCIKVGKSPCHYVKEIRILFLSSTILKN
jgi:hypothetical protein